MAFRILPDFTWSYALWGVVICASAFFGAVNLIGTCALGSSGLKAEYLPLTGDEYCMQIVAAIEEQRADMLAMVQAPA